MTPSVRWISVVVLLVPAVAVGLLAVTGGLAAPGNGLPDPGTLVRWGLPVARGLRDLAAAGTVGFLVAAAALLPGSSRRVVSLSQVQRRTVRLGAHFAVPWAVLGAIVLVLTFR